MIPLYAEMPEPIETLDSCSTVPTNISVPNQKNDGENMSSLVCINGVLYTALGGIEWSESGFGSPDASPYYNIKFLTQVEHRTETDGLGSFVSCYCKKGQLYTVPLSNGNKNP